MTWFVSSRERRLWTWVVVVVTAIYSTLGLAGQLAEELTDRNLIDGIFFLAFLVILAAIFLQGLRARPGGLEIGAMLGIGAVYVLVVLRMGIPAVERTHLVEYGVVAILVHTALVEGASHGRRLRSPALLAIAITTVIGVVDECIQAVLPNRVFDPVDIAFNALAAVMSIAAVVLLSRARRHTEQLGSRRRGARRATDVR